MVLDRDYFVAGHGPIDEAKIGREADLARCTDTGGDRANIRGGKLKNLVD
jgi:hypothetical protein